VIEAIRSTHSRLLHRRSRDRQVEGPQLSLELGGIEPFGLGEKQVATQQLQLLLGVAVGQTQRIALGGQRGQLGRIDDIAAEAIVPPVRYRSKMIPYGAGFLLSRRTQPLSKQTCLALQSPTLAWSLTQNLGSAC
jgi:hypothetical protein